MAKEKEETKPEATPVAPPAVGDLSKAIQDQMAKMTALEAKLTEMQTTQAGMSEKYKVIDELSGMIKPLMDQLATGKMKTGNPLIDGMLGPVFADLAKLKGQVSKPMGPHLVEKK